MNRPALAELARFVETPSAINASRLVGIPAVYDVLKYHANNPTFPEPVIGLCRWLHMRGNTILQQLMVHSMEPIKEGEAFEELDWRKVNISIAWRSI